MVFLLSQMFNGAKSSIHRANKPAILVLNKAKYLSKPLQNSLGVPMQQAKLQVQESLCKIIGLPHLNKIQQAIGKAFRQEQRKINFPDYLNKTQNAEQYYLSNTRITKRSSLIEANPYTEVDYRYNSAYSKHHTIQHHLIKEFELDEPKDKDYKNLNGLMSFFLNSNNPIKLEKAIFSSNIPQQKKSLEQNQYLSAKGVFDIIDPHLSNTTVIKNIKLIDKDLALNLANNKQRLIVYNGSEFYVLIPRLENNQVNNNQQVFWHLISENNLNAVYSYGQLTDKQKQSYTKSQFDNIWKQALLVNQDNCDITDRILNRLLLQKSSFEKNFFLKQEWLKSNPHKNKSNLYLYIPLQEAEQELKSCNKELEATKIKYISLKNREEIFNSLNSNAVNITDILSKYTIAYANNFSLINKEYLINDISKNLNPHLSLKQKDLIYQFILACINKFDSKISKNHNFSLHDMLSLIQSDNNNELTITASKHKHKLYSSLIKPKISDLAKTYKLQEHLNKQNNNEENLLNALSTLVGKSVKEFSHDNPALARNILDGINQKHGLKKLIRASGEHIDRYDLTNIYKTQDVINSKSRKNGGALLNEHIQNALAKKQTCLLELNPKVSYPFVNFVNFAKPAFICLNYNIKNRCWEAKSIYSSRLDLSQSRNMGKNDNTDRNLSIADLHSWLRQTSKDYNADLYIQRDKEALFSREAYLCKFKKNISTPALDLYDKLIKHKAVWQGARANRAIYYIYKGIKLRNYTAGEYKLKVKPQKNVVTRFFNTYINPFSMENTNSRKIGKYFRKAAYDHEDSFRRYWGFFKGGLGQPQDTLLSHMAIIGGLLGNHAAFEDSTVQTAFHQGLDFFAQLLADAVQPLSYHTMAKYGHLFSVGLGKTVKEIRHDINNLKKIISNNMNLLDTAAIDNNQNIYIDGRLIENKEKAKGIIKDKLLEAFAALLSLIYQSKAQDKIYIAIAFIDQFFQNLLGRAGYFAMAIFSPGAEHTPILKKLYRLIRRGIQTPLAGVDNINRQRYLDNTHIYMPSHIMTDRALKYNLDKYMGKLPQDEFEKNIIRIMIDNHETHYTYKDFNNMNQKQIDGVIAGFLIDPVKVHNNAVSYNIERRIDIIQSYIIEVYAEHRKLEYQYKQKIIELKNYTDDISSKKSYEQIAYYQNKLEFTQEKIAQLKEEEILFHQGLQYNRDINLNLPKQDYINWQFSWGTLQKNYPSGFLAEFINPKDILPVINKKIALLFKQPNEALMHIFFRASNSAILATDEVATSVATQVEKTESALAAQVTVMALLSTTFTAGISSGVIRYFENASTFGKPRGHFIYICAMIWAIDKKLSQINREMSKITNDDKQSDDKFNKLLENSKSLLKIKEFLENDAKPKVSVNRITNTNKNLDSAEFKRKMAEFIASSTASLIPRKEGSRLNAFRTDENRILDIINSAKKRTNDWYKTQSVIYPIAQKLKGKFGNKNPNIDDNSKNNLAMFNNLFKKFILQAQNDVKLSYEYMIENLFNKIPNSSDGKGIDHAVNRREFITKMQILSDGLLTILEEAIKDYVEYSDEKNSLAYINNLHKLKQGIDIFLSSHKDENMPYAVEYINLHDIKSTEQGEIFFNRVNSKQNITNKNNSSHKIKLDLSSSYMWKNWNSYGGLETQPNDSMWHKTLSRMKKVSSFACKYILPVTNPLHRRFLPTMYLQNTITTPVTAWNKMRLVHEVRKASYTAQQALNNNNLQNIIENDLHKLSARLKITDTVILNTSKTSTTHILSRLTKERNELSQKREELLLNTSQAFRVDDKISKQALKLINFGKPTKFEQNIQDFLNLRKHRLTKLLHTYEVPLFS